MLLASCDYEEAKRYTSKLVKVVDDEDSTKKPEKVSLNVVVDIPNDAYELSKNSVMCITCSNSPSYCPSDWVGNVFRIYDLDTIEECNKEVEGVVPLLVLPNDFSDMKKLYDLMMLYPRARAMGGLLLEIPGIRIGRYDGGKEKMSSVYKGVYDLFHEIPLEDIRVKEISSKKGLGLGVRKTGGIKKATKEPAKKQKVLTFEKFFTTSGVEF